MKIHHLRNATFIIEAGAQFILVDPMLGPVGSGMPFTLFRFKPRKNPTVGLPENTNALLEKVTHCMITHLHPDHIDPAAMSMLRKNNTPVVCSSLDKKVLEKKGLNIQLSLDYWEPTEYLGGKVIGIPAIHGYGFVKKIAGNVMGFYLELPGEKSIYISSDTVYTEHVDRALSEYQPDITVMAAGKAQLDIGQPLLMHQDDMVKFVQQSPGRVLANHMEALNHCPHTRADLKQLLADNNLLDKVDIPEDGEAVSYE
ncbi:MAG: MBL fold metallo-hydrolase [Bacteroidota bacterium]